MENNSIIIEVFFQILTTAESFGKVLAELLYKKGLGQCVEDARVLLTPYGGRLGQSLFLYICKYWWVYFKYWNSSKFLKEYEIQGINFHVHLKNAERVQEGDQKMII